MKTLLSTKELRRGSSKILKISLPLMFAQSVQFIMAWTDKLMLGNMLGNYNIIIEQYNKLI